MLVKRNLNLTSVQSWTYLTVWSKKVTDFDQFGPKKGMLFPLSGSIVFPFEHWKLSAFLRWLPIVYWPRASWFRKSRDGVSFQTLRQNRARNHAVRCRQTWRSNFYNLFIENVAWIGSGFQMFIDLNRRPFLPCLKEKCTRYTGVPTNEADSFDRHVHDHRAGQSKVVYYHTYLQSLALFVKQTPRSRYESGCDSPTSLVVWRARGARADALK